MNIKLLAEHHLEILSLTEGCTGSSESIHVKMPHCWKSHVVAQMWARGLNFDLGLHRHRFVVCACSKGSGEPAHLHVLA